MSRRFIIALLGAGILFGGVQPVRALMNEALSFALEAAAPYVKKGFSVRQDNWSGKMSIGHKKGIKHQLFKGNEYWFWAGTDHPDAKVTVKIYDKKGRPVHVETKAGKKTASARVLAPKTGTYLIVIEAKPADPKKKKEFKPGSVGWGLVYGFR